MRGLEIRCQFAVLISINGHLREMPMTEATDVEPDLGEILEIAYGEGMNDGFNSAERADLSEAPCMFKDEKFLLHAWACGYKAGRSNYEVEKAMTALGF